MKNLMGCSTWLCKLSQCNLVLESAFKTIIQFETIMPFNSVSKNGRTNKRAQERKEVTNERRKNVVLGLECHDTHSGLAHLISGLVNSTRDPVNSDPMQDGLTVHPIMTFLVIGI